jgi:WD40 repeat protein
MSRTESRCPDPATLTACLEATLGDAEQTEVFAHLEHCALCARTVEQRLLADDLVRNLCGSNCSEALRRTVASNWTVPVDHLPELALRARDEAPAGDLDSAPLQPGCSVDGYEIQRPLGSGGMGVVYLARDPRLQRDVALKVMKRGQFSSADACARFLREARAAAALQNDHILPVYQAGEDGSTLYVVMPLLAGRTLANRLKEHGRLPAVELKGLARDLTDALVAAHGAGILHRDLKPSNVWLESPSGRARLFDFGLASSVGPEADQITLSGQIMGTPGYMSPEQIEGRVADSRSDLFSLGCVLYEAASGVRPFSGPGIYATLRATVEQRVEPLNLRRPDLPADLCGLIEELLNKSPAQRPGSAADVAARLEAPIATAVRRRTTSQRTLLLSSAAIVALLAGAALFWLVDKTRVRFRDDEGREQIVELPEGATDVRIEHPPLPMRSTCPPLSRREFGATYASLPERIDGVDSWDVIPVMPGPGNDRLTGQVSEDQRWLILSGNMDRYLRVFDMQTGQLARAFPHAATSWPAISPDGSLVACVNDFNTVDIWDVDTGQRVCQALFDRKNINLAERAPVWIPGTSLLTIAVDDSLEIVDTTSGRAVAGITLPGNPLTFVSASPDGRNLAAFVGAKLLILDRTTQQVVARISEPAGRPFSANSRAVWSPDGRQLLITAPESFLVSTSDWITTVPVSASSVQRFSVWPSGSAGPVIQQTRIDPVFGQENERFPDDLIVTNDGQYLIQMQDGGVSVLQLASRKPVCTLPFRLTQAPSIGLYERGRKAVLSTGHVVDLETGSLLLKSKSFGLGGPILISPDGSEAASLTLDRVLDLQTGEMDTRPFSMLGWSPDSRYRIGENNVGSERLLFVEDRVSRTVRTFAAPTPGAWWTSIAFSTDGTRLYCLDSVGGLACVQFPEGHVLNRWTMPSPGPPGITDVSPDGRFLCACGRLVDTETGTVDDSAGWSLGWSEEGDELFVRHGSFARVAWPDRKPAAVLDAWNSHESPANILALRVNAGRWSTRSRILDLNDPDRRLQILLLNQSVVCGISTSGHYFATRPPGELVARVVRRGDLLTVVHDSSAPAELTFLNDPARALFQ